MKIQDIGIDKMGVYVPPLYLDMKDLAKARGEEPDKYIVGLGQEKMAIPPLSQDVVSMGANAALQILDEEDKEKIDLVILGTETGIDKSKAGAIYIHELTGIQAFARSIEVKQACYAGTAALQMAVNHIAQHPDSKALVIASDIAKYGLETSGESTQGAGAVALLVSAYPRLAQISTQSLALTSDIMDFWKPNYLDYPEVKGQYSSVMYLELLSRLWEEYQIRYNRSIEDYEAFLFHLPFTKLGEKGLRKVMKGASVEKKETMKNHFEHTRYLSKNVGNIYTGSLYLSLASSLIWDDQLKAGDKLAAFSYGSGAVGELFELDLVDGYQKFLAKESILNLLDQRKQISIEDYEALYLKDLPTDGAEHKLDISLDNSDIILAGIIYHERQYKKQ